MSTLRVGTLSNSSGSASVPSDTVISGTAKAWVNFNGTGTVAIRSQFNVSSITDNGTGDYTVNFTTAMPDTNYVLVVQTPTRSRANYFDAPLTTDGETRTVSAARMWVQNGGNVYDSITNNIVIFR